MPREATRGVLSGESCFCCVRSPYVRSVRHTASHTNRELRWGLCRHDGAPRCRTGAISCIRSGRRASIGCRSEQQNGLCKPPNTFQVLALLSWPWSRFVRGMCFGLAAMSFCTCLFEQAFSFCVVLMLLATVCFSAKLPRNGSVCFCGEKTVLK